MVSTVYSYAVGRSVDTVDQATLSALTQAFVAGGATLPELFAGVATSSAITERCGSGAE
jgi:hypothetical protein